MSQTQIEERLSNLYQVKQTLEDDCLDVKQNNSYCNSSTGYNYVSDVEYTDEYNDVCDQISELEKQLQSL